MNPTDASPVAAAWTCLAVVLLGLALALVVSVPVGTWFLAGSCLALAVIRGLTPGQAWRIARSRSFDVGLLVLVAVALAALSLGPNL